MSKKRKKKNGRKERIIGNNSKYIGTYTITEEPFEDKHTKRIPKEIRKRAEELHDMLLHKPKKVIPLLLGYIKKYPNVPLLYNYLSAAYGRIGDLEKVESTVVENLNKHPDYLFAKLNYADICLRKGKASKVPNIFNHKLDLKLLYPKRSTFHISEFAGFAVIICKYYNAIGEREVAESLYENLRVIAPNELATEEAKKDLYPSILGRLFRRIVTIKYHKRNLM